MANLRVNTGLIVLSDGFHNQFIIPYGGWFDFSKREIWGFYRYHQADMPAHGRNPAGICLASYGPIKEFHCP